MAQNQKSYDNEFKAQAVKLAQEIGGHKAANELGIPKGTMYTWIKAFKEGRLSANEAVHPPKNALSLNDELIELMEMEVELLSGSVPEMEIMIALAQISGSVYSSFHSTHL